MIQTGVPDAPHAYLPAMYPSYTAAKAEVALAVSFAPCANDSRKATSTRRERKTWRTSSSLSPLSHAPPERSACGDTKLSCGASLCTVDETSASVVARGSVVGTGVVFVLVLWMSSSFFLLLVVVVVLLLVVLL
eukprot:2738651-Pleurochrysis_carterae.AAC.2